MGKNENTCKWNSRGTPRNGYLCYIKRRPGSDGFLLGWLLVALAQKQLFSEKLRLPKEYYRYLLGGQDIPPHTIQNDLEITGEGHKGHSKQIAIFLSLLKERIEVLEHSEDGNIDIPK